MQTGQRGAQHPAPGNVTGMTFYKQQREQAAKRKAHTRLEAWAGSPTSCRAAQTTTAPGRSDYGRQP